MELGVQFVFELKSVSVEKKISCKGMKINEERNL